MRDLMILNQVKIWIDAARPKTLWASIAPVIIGTAMAYSDGNWDPLIATLTMFSAMMIQIGTNYANDYYDYFKGADTRDRIGPVRATGSGLVKPQTMRVAYFVTYGLSIIFGLYLIGRGGWPIVVIGTFSIILGILYTGGPFPLGYKGLGEVFVLIFFGPVAVGGAYYLQTLEINRAVILAGLSPGLISTALLTVNNLRDIHTDEKAGKRTLAVRFGPIFARIEYLLSILLACLMPLILLIVDPAHPYSLAAILVIILAGHPIKAVLFDDISPDLNSALARTGKLLLFYSLVFSLGWIV
jgi:1,4-dihydroxy-2-naphthoate octaprenyltransferase